LFNRTGNFNKAIKKQAEKATKAMFEVLKRGRRHNLSPNVGITCIIKNVFNMFNPRKIQIFINKKVMQNFIG
jgi:hypothetical protein